MRKPILFYLFLLFAVHLSGQDRVSDRFASLLAHQLKLFPQEKIYLHTDKPYYLSGEQVWFRAHLVDAALHTPVFASHYVYVELINPLDSVVRRLKIRQTDSIYRGRIALPPDLPEGDYMLRAYTHFMKNLDEHYWCNKNIHIGDPQASGIHIDTQFYFASNQKVTAEFRFTHPALSEAVLPESVKVSVNGGKQMTINCDGNFASVTFDLSSDREKRVILLEIEKGSRIYRQFISVPVPEDDFDVTFYPEGGTLLEGTFARVAFKALKSNGRSSEITGVVYEKEGKEVTRMKSDYSGMGMFGLFCEEGKAYYAICTNEKGESKQFDLPTACRDGYSLSVNQRRGNLHISVTQAVEAVQLDTLYLLAHTRGVVHCAEVLVEGKRDIHIPDNLFPSGVLQLLLLDSGLRPLSERLVFIYHNAQAIVGVRTDKENYTGRSLVNAEVTLTDGDQQPLTGNFSVSVTDDNEVKRDSCNNILVSLLLTSDLKGYIERPASYFDNPTASAKRLDLLMLTQGWRRYNIDALTAGTFSYPTVALELGGEISGTVKSALTGKASVGKQVTLFSTNRKYFDRTTTDENGNFCFFCDLPDSTHFIVHADPRRGIRRIDINQEDYPGKTIPAIPQDKITRDVFALYAGKTEQKYTYEQGMRMVYLEAVTVSALRKPQRESVYYSEPDYSIGEEYLDKFRPNTMQDIYMLLSQVPGVRVSNEGVQIIGGVSFLLESSPLIFIDDFPASLEEVIPQHIAQIDVLKNGSIFGVRGSGGAILFYTKDPKNLPPREQPHVKLVTPLGYQVPVEFYSPKYDLPEAREKGIPDLRTTIHWEPSVKVDSTGKAAFCFYTADSETTYTCVIQGVTVDGKIIHQKAQIRRDAR